MCISRVSTRREILNLPEKKCVNPISRTTHAWYIYRGIILRYCHRYASVFPAGEFFEYVVEKLPDTESPTSKKIIRLSDCEGGGEDLKELEEVCPNERTSKQASKRACGSERVFVCMYVCVCVCVSVGLQVYSCEQNELSLLPTVSPV